MQNFLSSRKVIWAFLAIGVVAVAVIVVAAFLPRSGNQVAVNKAPKPKTPVLKVDRTAVPAGQLPAKFPSDLPVEANTKVIDNFDATASNGNSQGTRVYQSANTPDENYKVFAAYFKKNSWTTLSTSNTVSDKSITAQKGNSIIQAIFYINTVTKASTVKLSLTILPDNSPAIKK